jgi:hypothetical protein
MYFLDGFVVDVWMGGFDECAATPRRRPGPGDLVVARAIWPGTGSRAS